MTYLHRSVESLVERTSKEYPALLVTGPRQVGKSTLLAHLAEREGSKRNHVSLDSMTERDLARSDPALFLQIHRPPVIIDEVQYAPELFTQIKIAVDAGAPAGSFWLTGSQPFQLMRLAGESLAGRVAIIPLSSLSQREAQGSPEPTPLSFEVEAMRERAASAKPRGMLELYGDMFRGSMPSIVSGERTDVGLFYESYLQTYIERDVRDLSGAIEALPFLDFMRSVAARCSQMLNRQAIARDIGARSETVRDWLGVLERSGVIFYLHPYSNNQLKRTVKAPKLYFHDTGLVAHLTRWSSGDTLASGAMAGAVMENHVVSEIRKGFMAQGREAPLYYYRDHDAKEIDLVLEQDGQLHPVEVKRSASPDLKMTSSFTALDRSPIPRGTGAIVCMAQGFGALSRNVLVIPAWAI